jgi:hypothetical protein
MRERERIKIEYQYETILRKERTLRLTNVNFDPHLWHFFTSESGRHIFCRAAASTVACFDPPDPFRGRDEESDAKESEKEERAEELEDDRPGVDEEEEDEEAEEEDAKKEDEVEEAEAADWSELGSWTTGEEVCCD